MILLQHCKACLIFLFFAKPNLWTELKWTELTRVEDGCRNPISQKLVYQYLNCSKITNICIWLAGNSYVRVQVIIRNTRLRITPPEGVALWKVALQNFVKFIGKQMQCSNSLVTPQVSDLQLFKKAFYYWCFPMNFGKFFRTNNF